MWDNGISAPLFIVLLTAFLYCLIFGLQMRQSANSDVNRFVTVYNDQITSFERTWKPQIMNSSFELVFQTGNVTAVVPMKLVSVPSPMNGRPGVVDFNQTVATATLTYTFPAPEPTDFKSPAYSITLRGLHSNAAHNQSKYNNTMVDLVLWSTFLYPISLQQGTQHSMSLRASH